jgi:hypothetical protein
LPAPTIVNFAAAGVDVPPVPVLPPAPPLPAPPLPPVAALPPVPAGVEVPGDASSFAPQPSITPLAINSEPSVSTNDPGAFLIDLLIDPRFDRRGELPRSLSVGKTHRLSSGRNGWDSKGSPRARDHSIGVVLQPKRISISALGSAFQA